MSDKCRCYINLKHYLKVVKTGNGTLKGYKPCPTHEPEEHKQFLKDKEESNESTSFRA